ncbi:MAG: phage holin family protein [Thiobacillus sp.]
MFESLKTLSASLLGMVHTRLALLSTDLEEQRAHVVSLFVLGVVALFCLCMGVLLLSILIVAALWQSHQLVALSGLTGVFLLIGLGVGQLVMHKARTKPRLFAASLAELSKDRQHLTSGS